MLRALVLVASTLQAVVASIQDCGKDTSLFQITELSLTPDPPQRGKDVEMVVLFNNPGFSVVSGTCKTSVTLNFVPFPESSEPLCQSTTCPLDMGDNERRSKSVWPDNVSGLVKSKLEWLNEQNEQLLCIQISTKVSGFPFKNTIGFYNESDTTFMSDLLNLRTTSSFEDWDPMEFDSSSYSIILPDTFNETNN
jgi:hypothetical protein